MSEVYVLVPVKRSFGTTVVSVLCMVLAVISVLLTCVSVFFLPVVLVLGIVWYMLTFRTFKEYEYSYFDGEVRFARIMNKSRRKAIASYTMDDVVMIAPAGDRSVYKYENDNQIKKKDYSSHFEGHAVYDMVLQKNGDLLLIRFEPDEDYLKAVEFKYKQKVVR